jgi:hypothetical protein
MGSIARMNRNERYIKTVGPNVLRAKGQYDFQKGDWFELLEFSMGQTEDGSELVKMYVTVQNKRTGDQFTFTDDSVQFDPEETSHDAVDRVATMLTNGYSSEKQIARSNKIAIRLLKKADLIPIEYDAEEVA